ncbi:hypothetical protein T310_1847 [Rasamsonia emersonii CBS 393.64]|uniref:Uncharacterized protein n=1 Tax=Rasamsonia emersonii (strain ATCC 16479 / CBS 393.64 / IMI 116815) TaxID=1408163 RepID=A0A0F4Z1Z6_RASE3|nr:hypothetical protein T310_1847 [Rasamsonia emersonii CBS 393.64]KKA24116.1 hypothetical protein T310_1847 [Rasamsonia emersonii CBS 393.64]
MSSVVPIASVLHYLLRGIFRTVIFEAEVIDKIDPQGSGDYPRCWVGAMDRCTQQECIRRRGDAKLLKRTIAGVPRDQAAPLTATAYEARMRAGMPPLPFSTPGAGLHLSTTLRPDLPSKSPINYSLLVLYTHCPVQCVCFPSAPVLRFFTPPRRHHLGPWPLSPGPSASPVTRLKHASTGTNLIQDPTHGAIAPDPGQLKSAFSSSTESCCRTWLAHFLQADRTLSSQNRFRKSPAVRSIHRAVSRYTSICQCSRFSSLAAREIAPDRVLHPFFASTDQSLRFLPAVLLATVRVGHIREAGAVGSRTITG